MAFDRMKAIGLSLGACLAFLVFGVSLVHRDAGTAVIGWLFIACSAAMLFVAVLVLVRSRWSSDGGDK
jgi:hypothetical protein